MKHIKEDWRWLLTFSFMILVITTLPYVLAYWRATSDWVFTGFVFGVEDGNSYIAKMLSGANGAWIFKSPYSAVYQRGLLAFVPYILLGKLTSTPGQHAQLVNLFQVFRGAAVVCLVFATYAFVSHFIKKMFYRRAAVIIATAGGGLGWLSVFGLHEVLGINLPLEFYSPETFGFLAILGLPHIAFARALLLLGFTLYLDKHQTTQKSMIAGGLWFLTGVFQPITLVTGCAVIFFDNLIPFLGDVLHRGRDNRLTVIQFFQRYRTPIVMFLFSSPWILYNLIAFRSDPYLTGWERQNIIDSPPPQDYLFSLWLVFIFVLIGFYLYRKNEKPDSFSLPAIWIILFPILAYAPHNLQRRLPEGVWVSLSILAIYAVQQIFKKRSRVFTAGYVLLSLFSSIMILAGVFQVSKTQNIPIYRPKSEIRAFEFLERTANPGDVIMASYKTSNALPAWAPLTVIAGHGPESIRLEEFSEFINAYYDGRLPVEEEEALVERYSVDYLFWGPLEQQLGELDPYQRENLETIYHEGSYSIFRFIKAEDTQ